MYVTLAYFSCAESFTTTLLKYVDSEELPAYLGGNKTDPDGDPRCSSQVEWLCSFLACLTLMSLSC